MFRSFSFVVCFVVAVFAQMAASAVPDTYTNPIAEGVRMGDPFILEHEGWFYLYGTTDSGRGYRSWKSRDLVEWQPVGYVYQSGVLTWGGKTFWAPEVFERDGTFYLVYSSQPGDTTAFDARICLAESASPEGPFIDVEAPLFDIGWSCIDGHVFIDHDGTPFLYFARVGSVDYEVDGEPGYYVYGDIYVARLKVDLSGIEGDPVLCLSASQDWENPDSLRARTNEGAYVFRVGDRYYLTYSANHYADPFYGIGYATADSPMGPWVKSKSNPIVAQNLKIGVSGPGHNMILAGPDGKERWMVYHTHGDPEIPSGQRVVNIDHLVVREDGSLELRGPTRTPQPLPGWIVE